MPCSTMADEAILRKCTYRSWPGIFQLPSVQGKDGCGHFVWKVKGSMAVPTEELEHIICCVSICCITHEMHSDIEWIDNSLPDVNISLPTITTSIPTVNHEHCIGNDYAVFKQHTIVTKHRLTKTQFSSSLGWVNADVVS